ncbi:unnamed protein product [Ostreobium quekettii]|uniref:Uncharacterized protein n=1 Tax=Ostreobium quekettii TaxID=121088 RepID=A0A8S1IN24_9CHLO|nr:unnamed protein product [Ostreobium quekettii]|eukprot:evm.model.scf_408.6 EVM.evm.TU.scf_408.6   scf_408:52874-53440(+)
MAPARAPCYCRSCCIQVGMSAKSDMSSATAAGLQLFIKSRWNLAWMTRVDVGAVVAVVFLLLVAALGATVTGCNAVNSRCSYDSVYLPSSGSYTGIGTLNWLSDSTISYLVVVDLQLWYPLVDFWAATVVQPFAILCLAVISELVVKVCNEWNEACLTLFMHLSHTAMILMAASGWLQLSHGPILAGN